MHRHSLLYFYRVTTSLLTHAHIEFFFLIFAWKFTSFRIFHKLSSISFIIERTLNHHRQLELNFSSFSLRNSIMKIIFVFHDFSLENFSFKLSKMKNFLNCDDLDSFLCDFTLCWRSNTKLYQQFQIVLVIQNIIDNNWKSLQFSMKILYKLKILCLTPR